MMANPELFEKYNGLPRRDAEQLLLYCSTKIKWKEDGDRIIDVGCGDGSVTMNVLKKFLPDNYVKLVGLDISEEAIKHCNNKYAKTNSKLQFFVHDIQKEVPAELKRSFDKVFSFYLFHFVSDNRSGFKNLYQLLADGGMCFVTFIAFTPLFETYCILSQTDKWRFISKQIDQIKSPFHHSQQPVAELKNIMEHAGSKNIEIKFQKKSFIFESIQYVGQIVRALNTFKLSEDVLDAFVSDYMRMALESGQLRLVPDDESDSRVRHDYELFFACATK